jgi:hypothetical protein
MVRLRNIFGFILIIILLGGIATGLYFLAMFIKNKYTPAAGKGASVNLLPIVKINRVDPVNVNPNSPPYARAHLTVKNCQPCNLGVFGDTYDSNGNRLGFFMNNQDTGSNSVNNGEVSVDLFGYGMGDNSNQNNVTIKVQALVNTAGNSSIHGPTDTYNGTLKFTSA